MSKKTKLELIAHWDGRYWRIATRDCKGNLGRVAAQGKYRTYSACISGIADLEREIDGCKVQPSATSTH